jgi:murein tripeptide amidase MpaA
MSDTPEAKHLRSHFVFRIIPMLNPDGVIYGNYRCSLLGFDLNRKWKDPDKILQPTIYHAKQTIKFLSQEREIALFCDFHAHSTTKNIFMYGCTYGNDSYYQVKKNASIRVIPLLMSQQDPYFSYFLSRFRIEKGRDSTARVVMFSEFHVSNSFTCESSFFGYF